MLNSQILTKPLRSHQLYLMANGDLRLRANQKCWPEQTRMEATLIRAIAAERWQAVRAHPYDPAKQHGFIDSQKMGLEVFRQLDPKARLVVAESVWQYSNHLLHGLLTHRGPILTVANWSGTWPGLVGLLNLNASLRKAGKAFDTLWSVDFTDRFFLDGLQSWLLGKRIVHDGSHVRAGSSLSLPGDMRRLGTELAE